MFSYFFIFYLAALIASLVTFKKYVDTPLRFFPLLIAYTIFNELLGYFILNYEAFSFFQEEEYHWHNIIIYNIYQVICFGYIFWLYHQLIRLVAYKRIIKICAAITFGMYGISLFFQDPLHTSLFYADTVGSIATVLIVLLHFFWLKKWTRYNLMIWINWGMLLFYLYFPINVLNAYLNLDFYLTYHLRQILWVFICLMYTFFTIGFIISKRSTFR